MTEQAPLAPALSPLEILAARQDNLSLRDRDLADKLGITEAQLVAAHVGIDATRISADLDDIFPRLPGLGNVMALTRNRSCVIEKVGQYENYRSGQHASMVLTADIDLRMFPSHWVSAFAVERTTDRTIRRSLQIFDAAGDAVHKIFLRDGSDLSHWNTIVRELRHEDQSQTLQVSRRKPVEAPKANPDKADVLRAEWAKMTDTHQFMRLTSKLKMNRLGAYRIAGEPLARRIEPTEVDTMLEAVRDQGIEVMVFVGNQGCIEIHGGPIETLKSMGPWQNVLDPHFNLHLRSDHIAEVWAVAKPTQRGPAVSVEAFDAEGGLIFQVFGRRSDTADHRPAWGKIVDGLQSAKQSEVA
ncbi:Hemin transport protein HemS [Falsiruegeria litorea R37]|uniref:Hemin transport protein HemS n=1 Tax=Falsiruegeria litorea R37 TaxID=1200284 RepID=A0A1Y5SVZ4_9RHOB|nr:ChuX/HutX family heme-like substrate-binding protein [Falsiruegeria litorea]SLN46429.1 Hemin transport protein HemS [Falsiruegeria litorea R37]